MTPADYRATLAALGLTHAGAAELVGVATGTSHSWAYRRRAIPEPVARFLRLLIAAGITPQQVMALLK
jgi:hypothetical protein